MVDYLPSVSRNHCRLILGNLLGALAAYVRKGFDKVDARLPAGEQHPGFRYGCDPSGDLCNRAEDFPDCRRVFPYHAANRSWSFFTSVIRHYQLPFWSIVIISIGGQALGMRSMSIYELNADYVKYSRVLGIKDRRIVRYVFRNAMLPQVTGLALSLGTMVSGALVAEIIFSYPGLGTSLLQAVTMADYPLLSATTLIITLMVLTATFIIDIVYGFIDPRVKAAQFDT